MQPTIRISRFRVFCWTIAVSLIFGAFDLGQPIEMRLRSAEDDVTMRPASGNIVVVAFDDKTLMEKGKFPWPRRYLAQIFDHLTNFHAAGVYLDGDSSSTTTPIEDNILQNSFIRAKPRITLGTHYVTDNVSGKGEDRGPNEIFRKYVDVASFNVRYNFWGMIINLPYSWESMGRVVPSMAAKMAGRTNIRGGEFPIDFSIDLRSIPVISASDVMDGHVRRSQIAGKVVIIGVTAPSLGDIYLAPSYGQVPGVFFHALGAESLKSGNPTSLGWLVPLLFAATLLMAAAGVVTTRLMAPVAAAEAACLLLISFLLHNWMIFVEIVPAMLFLALAGGRFAWLNFRNSYRVRGTINAISGLPNLKALRDLRLEGERPLVVGRIQNFSGITSALMPEKEKALVDQIAKRLMIGSSTAQLYQGDEGLFAWVAEPENADVLDDHLVALHRLFRQPVMLGTEQLDLVINFGVDRDASRSMPNRLGSALVAAEEAAVEGVGWKDHDPAKLKDAAWNLSVLSQLDAAIDAGDLWVAYQCKIDLVTRRVVGAEALVRWSHPEKGEIQPDSFIKAAEQGNRIDKLTLYVLDHALEATAEMLTHGVDFSMAVNLSARLVEDPALVAAVVALLEKHKVSPRHLTLEITETAALGQTEASLATLNQLRGLGMELSIDDYGTGMSTLDYLRRIPASQIKIDRCFVDSIDRGGGDLVMVNSTIQLAHSLGLEVVAEGVERQRTLDILTDLGCDTAQGYLIGRPTSFAALKERVLQEHTPQQRGQIRL